MGWDTFDYKGKQQYFHDGNLWILRHFILEEARNLESADSEIVAAKKFAERWEWLVPGVYGGTELDPALGGVPAKEKAMLELLNRTIGRLRGFGGLIPLPYLEEHINEGLCRYTGDQDTERFIELAQSLIRLIDPESDSKSQR